MQGNMIKIKKGEDLRSRDFPAPEIIAVFLG